MAVITISRQYGSGGDEIAALLCKETGCGLFDKFILAKAAAEAGLSEEEIVDYSEEHHRVQNFLSRLFGSSRSVAQRSVWREDVSGARIAETIHLTEESALALVRKAVEYAGRLGNTVIIGRGGQVILQDSPGVLHVRIEAPLENRILRVRNDPQMAEHHFDSQVEARRFAQNLIETRDIASADYLKRFYGVDWSDPMLYHLIVNTGKLSLENAVRLIAETARLLERVPETA